MEWLENHDYAELNATKAHKQNSSLKEVVLVEERSGADSRTIWASLAENGDLVISGHDIGPKVERYLDCDEYEFAHTIPFDYVLPFLKILGATKVTDVLTVLRHFGGPRYQEITDALETSKQSMPIRFWSHS
ncbi:hypothetical protein EMGBS4_18790 [Acidimicrobiaceae bacterium]|nr:hypothetical protein EMGBS4_18790 [Acidimicrobiaceae bacterium]